MNWLGLLKEYGFPTVVALGLGLLLKQQMDMQRAERVDHTALLIDQMSALRHACDPRAP